MQLREYVQVLYQRWWLVALTALFAVVSAYAYTRTQTPIFRSSVKLEVTGRIDYGQVLAIGQLLRQLAARVETTDVATSVDQRLRLDLGYEAILEKIHTQAFPDTIQIQLDVDDVDPARAEAIARELATVVKERQDALMAPVPQQERINLGIVDRPTPPRLFWPQTRIVVFAAGLLGLLFGAVLAFVLDYLDDTFHGPDDIERYLALPTLGMVPLGGERASRGLRWLAPSAEPVGASRSNGTETPVPEEPVTPAAKDKQ